MFCSFYDPRENRDMDLRGGVTLKGKSMLKDKHSAPRTVEQILFLLESVDSIGGERPAPVAS